MKQEEQQAIALARYAAIAPLVTDQVRESRKQFYVSVSEKGVLYPDGTLRHPSPGTIQRWFQDYRRKGFDGLIPQGRSDCGLSRTLDEDAKEKIRYYHLQFPRMSAAAIYRQLRDDGTFMYGECSESTVLRFIRRMDHDRRETGNKDMRRYERAHINEVWYGDSSVGPRLKTEDGQVHKVYIIALIDDASRMIVGANAFFNDNFLNLMSVMKSAVSKYGRPQMFSFDNGRPYKNHQMELLAARIGTTLNYCQPYTPTSKAKIERWFRSMKDQWMASLNMKDFHSLDELRGSLYTYIQTYNQRLHSSLHGLSPQDRFFQEPSWIHRLPPEQIDQLFLLETERKVSADSVIVIDQKEYEVDYRFAKQRIRLRYAPDMKEVYLVEPSGELFKIRLLNKTDNASVKRAPVYLSGGENS